MSTEIIVAIITGCLALLGTAVGTFGGIRANAKVTDYKLEELTREVREHNDFARRVPVIEKDVKHIYHELDEIKHGLKK